MGGGILIPPSWLLGTLLALVYAALFKFLLPERTRSVFLCAALAVVGFFVGNAVAGWLGLAALRLGELNLLAASFGALFALAIANLWRA